MKLVKCENGHFYDEERYDKCPHCSAPSSRNDNLTMPVVNTPSSDAVTVDMNSAVNAAPPAPAPKAAPSLQDAVKAASSSSAAAVSAAGGDEKTVSFFTDKIGVEPVVGWLVCIEGPHFGEDFRLKSGRNFIGRGSDMDVAIVRDSTVSRERHAIIVYEPKNNMFIVQSGDSKELSYLNDGVVLSAKEAGANDVLTVGKTKLMLIPCCSDKFNWDMVKKEA